MKNTKTFFVTKSMEDKEKESISLRAEKYNKENMLCGFFTKDLTGTNMSEENITLLTELIEKTGYKVSIKRVSYTGVYDPPRHVEVIAMYDTNEMLFEKEIRFLNFHIKELKEKVNKKWWR